MLALTALTPALGTLVPTLASEASLFTAQLGEWLERQGEVESGAPAEDLVRWARESRPRFRQAVLALMSEGAGPHAVATTDVARTMLPVLEQGAAQLVRIPVTHGEIAAVEAKLRSIGAYLAFQVEGGSDPAAEYPQTWSGTLWIEKWLAQLVSPDEPCPDPADCKEVVGRFANQGLKKRAAFAAQELLPRVSAHHGTPSRQSSWLQGLCMGLAHCAGEEMAFVALLNIRETAARLAEPDWQAINLAAVAHAAGVAGFAADPENEDLILAVLQGPAGWLDHIADPFQQTEASCALIRAEYYCGKVARARNRLEVQQQRLGELSLRTKQEGEAALSEAFMALARASAECGGAVYRDKTLSLLAEATEALWFIASGRERAQQIQRLAKEIQKIHTLFFTLGSDKDYLGVLIELFKKVRALQNPALRATARHQILATLRELGWDASDLFIIEEAGRNDLLDALEDATKLHDPISRTRAYIALCSLYGAKGHPEMMCVFMKKAYEDLRDSLDPAQPERVGIETLLVTALGAGLAHLETPSRRRLDWLTDCLRLAAQLIAAYTGGVESQLFLYQEAIQVAHQIGETWLGLDFISEARALLPLETFETTRERNRAALDTLEGKLRQPRP